MLLVKKWDRYGFAAQQMQREKEFSKAMEYHRQLLRLFYSVVH
jgi:hypothetical protein